MKAPLGLTLVFAAAAGAQFIEVQVDASAGRGEIRPLFGIDAPSDPRQAKLLLERGFEGPLRLGPAAALRAELAAGLPGAWIDETSLPLYDGRSSQRPEDGVLLWTLAPPDDPVEEAAEALAFAIGLQQTAVQRTYYKRRNAGWFDSNGDPLPALKAFELATRISETPQRVQLESGAETIAGLAGVSADGDMVQVLLVRREPREGATDEPASVVLYVRNLPWGASEFRVERYRLDAKSNGAGRGGMARLSTSFSAPGVELIVLRKADAAGADVIRRRSRPPR